LSGLREVSYKKSNRNMGLWAKKTPTVCDGEGVGYPLLGKGKTVADLCNSPPGIGFMLELIECAGVIQVTIVRPATAC
jgi:hypothetical protein